MQSDSTSDPRGTLIVTRYPNEKSNRPNSKQRGTFNDLAVELKTHHRTICSIKSCEGKTCPYKHGRAFAAHELKSGTTRATANVLRIWAAIFDLDDLTPDQAKDLIRRLMASGLACVVSSTHSHRPGAPKLRLAIELSRPVSPVEWPAVWEAINKGLELRADANARDPARLFFAPTCPSDVKPFAWSRAGAPYDVEAALFDVPPVLPRVAMSGGDWVGVLDSLREGNRDNGLTRLAGVLFRELSPRLAEALIHSVNSSHCRPPLDSAQVEKIAASVARRELARGPQFVGGRR